MDSGTRWSIHHSRWVRSLTSTVWVCLDSAETKVMLLAHRFIQTESPTGWSSALRIRTTTTNHPASVVTAEGGGSTTAPGQCSLITTKMPSGMRTRVRTHTTLFLLVCWWSWINTDHREWRRDVCCSRGIPTDLYKYSPDAVPPIHAVSYHVATDKPPLPKMATSSGLFLATIYNQLNQSQLAERKHVARYWSINTAATAVPLSAHPSPLVITTKLAAAILGGRLFGGGVLPAQHCPCGYTGYKLQV